MQNEGVQADELTLKRLALLYREAGETVPFQEPPVNEHCFKMPCIQTQASNADRCMTDTDFSISLCKMSSSHFVILHLLGPRSIFTFKVFFFPHLKWHKRTRMLFTTCQNRTLMFLSNVRGDFQPSIPPSPWTTKLSAHLLSVHKAISGSTPSRSIQLHPSFLRSRSRR